MEFRRLGICNEISECGICNVGMGIGNRNENLEQKSTGMGIWNGDHVSMVWNEEVLSLGFLHRLIMYEIWDTLI